MTVLEFMGKIESLNKDPATFLHAFLLNKLPANVRSMLANTEFKSMTELALSADKIIKAQKTKSTVNAVLSKANPKTEEAGEVDAIGKLLSKGRPFRILAKEAKFFTVLKAGKHDKVSIDRLKPAFMQQPSKTSDVIPEAGNSKHGVSTDVAVPGHHKYAKLICLYMLYQLIGIGIG